MTSSSAMMHGICWLMGGFALLGINAPGCCAERDYRFDGAISRPVLENYLSRSITFAEMLHGAGNVEANIHFLTHTGAKFIGRSLYMWGGEGGIETLLGKAKPIAGQLHAADPDMLLQAAVFEIVTTEVEGIAVPPWVFEAFGLPAETRNFRYAAMKYPGDAWQNDHWRPGASVPDMSQTETRLWFYYLAARYIDIGVEAIHFGQVEIMDDRDLDHVYWREMMEKARAYAHTHARRHLLLCDAHVPSGGIAHDGKLMFDFHSFPLRIEEVVDKPQQGVLQVGYLDSIFTRSAGGIAPSGWACEHLPYIAELDNFEASGHPGENIGQHWCWGYDEICWFANQPEEYRDEWLRYAWDWIRKTDPNGYLQMPGSRCLATPPPDKTWYWAHTPCAAVPDGFGQEETIKALWAEN